MVATQTKRRVRTPGRGLRGRSLPVCVARFIPWVYPLVGIATSGSCSQDLLRWAVVHVRLKTGARSPEPGSGSLSNLGAVVRVHDLEAHRREPIADGVRRGEVLCLPSLVAFSNQFLDLRVGL